MRDKITKGMVQKQFEYFAKHFKDGNTLQLDYYRGYQIEQTNNINTGVSLPFGLGRFTTREMFNMLKFYNDIQTSIKYETVTQVVTESVMS